MPPSTARLLCGAFFDLSSLDKTEDTRKQVTEIIDQVSYNPRALQYFLDDATSRLYNTKTHETKRILGKLRAAVGHAFGRWEKGVEGELGTETQHSELFKAFLALIFIYPKHFGASVTDMDTEEEGIIVSPAHILSMTGQILEFHNAGALRARSDQDGGKLLLLKPRGFLARHLLGPRRIIGAAHHNVVLVRHWICQSEGERISGKGHLFERVIAAGITFLFFCPPGFGNSL